MILKLSVNNQSVESSGITKGLQGCPVRICMEQL